MAGDFNFDKRVSLLHFEGADASTTFTDVLGKIWTPGGNAQIDTAQFKYGSASGLFDGTGDYLSTPEHADFDFGTGDFTIECFARFNALPANSAIIRKSNGANIGWLVLQTASTAIHLYASSNGTSWDICSGKVIGTGIATGVWYHIAISRTGTTLNAWINGALGTASTFPLTTSASIINYPAAGSTPVTVGGDGIGGVSLNGWIDELRITKGRGEYPAAFTIPAAAFPDFQAPIGNAAFNLPMLLLNWVDGIAQFDLPMLTVDGTGIGGSVGTADALALPMLGLFDASAVSGGIGSAAFDLPMLDVAAGGGDSTDIVLPMLTIEAQGMTGEVGQADFALPMLGLDASGFASVIGNANFDLPMLSLEANSFVGVIGVAEFNLPALGLSASGVGGIVGNASIVLPMLTLVAKGSGPAFGTAEFDLPVIWLSALGRTAISANFRAWAINMRNKALTEYKDLVFNSFATFDGEVYGASATGIYELGTQATDAGVAISATLRTGKNDYTSSFLKRIPRLYVNGDFLGDMTFKAITVEQGSYTYPLASHGAGLRACRVVLGKGLKSRQYQFEVGNVAGSDFSINSIGAYPIVIGRRVSSA